MCHTRYSTLLIAVLGVALACHAAQAAPPSDADESELIELLQSDAPKADKAITCKKLAVVGSKKAVPALSPYLSDPELASWARIALEVIPGPAADKALRTAAEKLEGRLLIGVLNSIAVRQDRKAEPILASRLKDDDANVAAAAAVALGRVGGKSAAKALQPALADSREAVRSAAARGCNLYAEKLLGNGKHRRSKKLYDQVRTADVPKQRRLEATRGAILARRDEGVPLLVEQLQSEDRDFVEIGVSTARELPGRKVTEALASELQNADAAKKLPILYALADRRDDAAVPALVRVAESGDTLIRLVAISALGDSGDASCVPTLLSAAVEKEQELREAALTALERIADKEVDEYVVAHLPKVDRARRKALIQLAGRRRVEAANALLLEAIQDSASEIRAEALAALGSTVDAENLSILIKEAVSGKQEQLRKIAMEALREASVRMPDREQCAKLLSEVLPKAEASVQEALLEILAAVGGENALETVAASAKDASTELQDAATRVLGQWMTADAAPVLLELAEGDLASKFEVRALRGYLRIARQFDLPIDQRAEMVRNALRVARRDDEKKMAIQVLQRYPGTETLQVALDATQDKSVEVEALAAIQEIVQKLGLQGDALKKALADGGLDPVTVEIVKAEYGVNGKSKDVTAVLRKSVGALPIVVLPSPAYNSAFGGDPAPGVPKQLRIVYKIDNRQGEVSLPENAAVILPMPEESS